MLYLTFQLQVKTQDEGFWNNPFLDLYISFWKYKNILEQLFAWFIIQKRLTKKQHI